MQTVDRVDRAQEEDLIRVLTQMEAGKVNSTRSASSKEKIVVQDKDEIAGH